MAFEEAVTSRDRALLLILHLLECHGCFYLRRGANLCIAPIPPVAGVTEAGVEVRATRLPRGRVIRAAVVTATIVIGRIMSLSS